MAKSMAETFGIQTDKWRIAGAPIYMRITVPKNGGGGIAVFSTYWYDYKGRFVRGDAKYIKNHFKRPLLYMTAVRKYQVLQDNNIHRYHMRLAMCAPYQPSQEVGFPGRGFHTRDCVGRRGSEEGPRPEAKLNDLVKVLNSTQPYT